MLDETFVEPNTSHQPLEPRTAMAYWQNGKLYLHGSTQSTVQTVGSLARWIGIAAENIVLISEYTGGGFGSKIPGVDLDGHSGAAVEESQRAGHDAHLRAKKSTPSAAPARRCTRGSRSASGKTAASPRST